MRINAFYCKMPISLSAALNELDLSREELEEELRQSDVGGYSTGYYSFNIVDCE